MRIIPGAFVALFLAFVYPSISHAAFLRVQPVTVAPPVAVVTTTAPSLQGRVTPLDTVTINPQPEPPKIVAPSAVSGVKVEGINQLNPQPEPPIPSVGAGVTGRQGTNQINPQPEPPAPTAVGSAPALNPNSARMINPQPEPPTSLPDIAPFDSRTAPQAEKVMQMSWPTVLNAPAIQTKLERAEKGMLLSMPGAAGELGKPLQIRGDLKVADGKAFLVKDKKEYQLSTLPFMGSQKITAALKNATIQNVALDVDQGAPVFVADFQDHGKLFGFIPMNVNQHAVIGFDKNIILREEKPWYSMFVSGMTNLASAMKLLPNLVVTDVRFVPEKFKEGDKVKVIGTVKNEGLGYAVGGLNIAKGVGPGAELILDGGTSSWYFIFLALGTGETQDFDFVWNTVKCGMDTGISVANGDFIEETTKEDNVKTAKAICQ
jgi:hypothetical protein